MVLWRLSAKNLRDRRKGNTPYPKSGMLALPALRKGHSNYLISLSLGILANDLELAWLLPWLRACVPGAALD